MAEHYNGLCIGGPMKGQSVANETRTLKVQHYNVGRLGGPSTESAIEHFSYNWMHTGAQGFWIPEGQSLHDAINEMALAYVEKYNG